MRRFTKGLTVIYPLHKNVRIEVITLAKKKVSPSSDLKVSKKDAMMYSQVLMGGAVVAVVLAGLGYIGTDIWLASTQWLLVAAVLSLFGIYLKMR